MTKNQKDQKHDLKMIVYGFILTGILGTSITFLFNHLENHHKIEADRRADSVRIMEQRREQATIVFNELSPLMDSRLYNWRRLAWGLEDQIPEDSLKQRYAEYEETFFKWNRNLNKNRALVCRFFGPDLGETFEGTIMPQFSDLHRVVHELYKTTRSRRPLIPSDSLNSLADSLNSVIYDFNNSMAERIRSGRVGLTDPGKACEFDSK
jgi:hypothetical protein